MVFADEDGRRWLEALLHPMVWQRCSDWMDEREAGSVAGVAVIVPLLYEAGWDANAWSYVVCVAAPRALQLERLTARGCSAADAEARLSAQWALDEKIRLADRLVLNSGTVRCLHQQVDSLVKELKQRS
jgi:dephospho-CoA kinase